INKIPASGALKAAASPAGENCLYFETGQGSANGFMAARQMQNNQFPAPRITVQCFSYMASSVIASGNSISAPAST
ncbi:hypothetical protein O5824_28195, partial [Escherichia coli]|nr:hypothetical protein [Escherichia coli]